MTVERVFPEDALRVIRFGLFEPTVWYEGSAWRWDVLDPWAADNSAILDALRQVGEARMAAVTLDSNDLCALYALSRVAEVLLLSSQPPAVGADNPGDRLPASAYREFVAAIGGTFPKQEEFHPFLHEIVEVESADDPQAGPELVAQWWPGCLIGSMLFVRAGVRVRAGAHRIDPVLATTSPLYWAWWRRHRPVVDLSQGWGSNSQWSTEFRRDYRLADSFVYNVDAALEARTPHPGGPPFNRDVDFLRHRCSTLVAYGTEEWVWDSHHTEPIPTTAPTSPLAP
ncbi:hypothetical protein ABT008_22805 [Micromonospora sp. NPDC002389]|uniref:hypothetical protein n=1 Tax=Micromonospora sp. NPDC002389 TaxID=3154272 RepID=UPI0033213678